MRIFQRDPLPDGVQLQRGEKVLSRAVADDGRVLVATRDALHLGSVSEDSARRIDWEQVETADWDGETSTFRVTEVGRWGEQRPVHVFVLDDARVFLELVHDRVTASIVIQRHVAVPNGTLRVIARRAPHGESRILWLYEYDEGVDPEDPEVQAAAEQALTLAKADVGLG
ncbi:hypothetical protein [Nocardioides gilvus]|uniref:hypothetical protein n=1 Tax=Nocardioides gilvus TaxID=1735589 RepID=UPI0013A57D70|nr:hypothetical protein [Nocardioides gilvus]